MARGQLGSVLGHIRRLIATRNTADRMDQELLRDFTANRSEAAFTELVRRHGRLVLMVCDQVLLHDQDVEDAFQATFVALARKAGSIHQGSSVASWL
jgi:DNA-directed RNA polymerase specialized sigma24 family protein